MKKKYGKGARSAGEVLMVCCQACREFQSTVRYTNRTCVLSSLADYEQQSWDMYLEGVWDSKVELN